MIIYAIQFLILSSALTSRKDKSILYSRNTIAILIYSYLIAVTSLDTAFLDKGLGLYGGLFHATAITQTFQIFIYIVCAIVLQLTAFYPRKVWHNMHSKLSNLLTHCFSYNNTNIVDKMGQQFKIIEYPLIILFVVTGAIFLISSSDIISTFLSIELQSYGLYLLSTLYRNSEASTSAGLTYFLLGGLSSCFILLGTSLLYANSGNTSLEGYYTITSVCSVANNTTTNMLD